MHPRKCTHQSKSLGSKLPQDLSADRFACPSGRVHWREACPKMTSCTFLTALPRAIFTPRLAAQAGTGSRGWGVIRSHLGSRRHAAKKAGSKSQILGGNSVVPLCSRQTLSLGRAGRQGVALPGPATPAPSPASGMEPAAPCQPCPCAPRCPALPGCSPIARRNVGAARWGCTCCRRHWPRRTCP